MPDFDKLRVLEPVHAAKKLCRACHTQEFIQILARTVAWPDSTVLSAAEVVTELD